MSTRYMYMYDDGSKKYLFCDPAWNGSKTPPRSESSSATFQASGLALTHSSYNMTIAVSGRHASTMTKVVVIH